MGCRKLDISPLEKAPLQLVYSAGSWPEKTGVSYSYFGARYYDPNISIWLSVDPLSDKSPYESPYTYCSGNPIKYVDPDGMLKWKPWSKMKERRAQKKIKVMNGNGYSYGNEKRGDPTGWGFNITRLLSKSEHNQSHKPQTNDNREDNKRQRTSAYNPLDRSIENTDDIDIYNRHDLTPKLRKGTVSMTYEPPTNHDGNTETATYEIGVVHSDGTEEPLVNTTTNEAGTISSNYELKKGEKLYTKGQGTINTTTRPQKQKNIE